jgi:hypothetical protein
VDYKFEHHWGGEDTWYTKGKRWANKQKFPINHLSLGILEWLWKHWVDGKVSMEMASVDKQTKEIKQQWERGEEPQTIVESKSSEVEGLDTISIKHKAFIPDPWEGDWNDIALNYKLWHKDNVDNF